MIDSRPTAPLETHSMNLGAKVLLRPLGIYYLPSSPLRLAFTLERNSLQPLRFPSGPPNTKKQPPPPVYTALLAAAQSSLRSMALWPIS